MKKANEDTINWGSRSYSKKEFLEAWYSSSSISEVLRKIGLNPSGGNYRIAKNTREKMGLSTDHMLGQASNSGRKFGPKRPIEDYLSNEFPIQSYRLKLRLFREGIFEKVCSSCKNTKWMGKPIPLELDHINGVNDDNRLENLRILCPNCHALTETYRGKNQDRAIENKENETKTKPKKKHYCQCGKEKSKRGKQCWNCYNEERQSHIPSATVLEKVLEKNNWNFSKVGRIYKVSDNAIRKWCKTR